MYDLDLLNLRIEDRWQHPELVDAVNACEVDLHYEVTFGPDIPFEERKKQTIDAWWDNFGSKLPPKDPERTTVYDFPGYAVAGDTLGHVMVTKPSSLKGKESKRKLPCLFNIPSGGLYMCQDLMASDEFLADTFNAVVVVCRYRTLFDGGKYPATVDDLDAEYKWVIDHADELGINPEKIIIWGESSGGHLSLALSHRLRDKGYYGHMPKGCVALEPVIDNRNMWLNSKRGALAWNTDGVAVSSWTWLGYDNNNPARLTGEVFPNYAKPEECVGLPPTFIHTPDGDPCVDPCMEYTSKLIRAGVYAEVHVWGGCDHYGLSYVKNTPEYFEQCPAAQRWWNIITSNVKDCLKYDLRRTFVKGILEGEVEPDKRPEE